jgi:putative DNA primase/helicase
VSVEVDGAKAGQWFDHEEGRGGGPIDLVQHARRTERRDAIKWLKNRFSLAPPSPPSAATYFDYRDAEGHVRFQVVREHPKKFWQRRPDGSGGWIKGRGGEPLLPYRLPELLASGDVEFIVEGEKDVETLRRWGLTATCNPGRAAKPGTSSKWPESLQPHFADRRVFILHDNDAAGAVHAEHVAKSLAPVAASIKFVNLPGLPAKGDVSDWATAGNGKNDLLALMEAAPEFALPLDEDRAWIAQLQKSPSGDP